MNKLSNIFSKKIQTLSKMGSRGASLLHLSETAENFGFRTLGVRISYSKFLTIPLPAIIHWKTNCFSVVYKITYRNVWIAEPGMGKFKVKKTAFCKDWFNENQEGIALLFELKKDR